jgi:DNA repair exonuclease SbcCD ATPase subunit
MNGAKTTDTNKIIKSIIGNYNDFITMTLSLQENNDGFVYLKQSQRKDFLYRIFRLNMFEKIEKLVGYDLRNKKSEYRLLNRKIQDYDMNGEQFEEKIKELNDIVLSNITGKINDAEIKYNNVISKLKSKNKDLQSLPFISDKYINAIKSIGVYLNDGYYNRYDNGHEYDNIDVSVMTTKELSKLIISIREYLKSENKNININKDNLIKNKEIEINNLYEDKNKSIQSELDSVILDENNELSNQKSNRSSVKKKLKKLKKEKKALLKKHPKYIEGGFGEDGNEDIGEDVPVIVTEYREFVSMKNNLMNELNMLSERHGRCIKMFEKLDGYEYNQDCEYCCKNPFVIEAENAGKESKVINKKINDIKQKLSEINTEMIDKFGMNSNSDGYCDINVVNIEELHNIIVNLNNKIVLCDDEISNSTKIIKFIKGKIKSLNTNAKNMIVLNHKQREIEIKNIYSDYDNKNKNVLEQLKILEDCLSILRQYKKIKKKNISVTKECNTLQLSAEQIKTEINYLLINKKETEIELNSIQEKFKDYQELIYDWTSLKDEIVILDLYNRAINKNGIPLYFLKKIVPEIERRINQNMSSFVDFKLHMDIDDKNINMFIAYGGNSNTEDGDGGKWNVANCCGFEKFIINLAIRIVIQNMANISKPNFIAFDEGWGCFDDKNLMNIYKIFDFMKMHYEFVLLITHIETLKNSVDRYANVIKNVDSGVSTISSTNI